VHITTSDSTNLYSSVFARQQSVSSVGEMDQLALLYGTSSVPYSPVSATPSALVLSADGQYAIATRGEINIFVRLFPHSFPLALFLLTL
jgi:hypothetical protein